MSFSFKTGTFSNVTVAVNFSKSINGTLVLTDEKIVFQNNVVDVMKLKYFQIANVSLIAGNDKNVLLKIISKTFGRYVFLFEQSNVTAVCHFSLTENINNLNESRAAQLDRTNSNLTAKESNSFKYEPIVFISKNFTSYDKIVSFCRSSPVNLDFQLTETCTEYLVVPSCVSDETVAKSACNYMNNRFPVISYIDVLNKSHLFRSSFPIITESGNLLVHSEEDVIFKEMLSNIPFTCITIVQLNQVTLDKRTAITLLSTTKSTYDIPVFIYEANFLSLKYLPLCLSDIASSINLIEPVSEKTDKNSPEMISDIKFGHFIDSVMACLNTAQFITGEIQKESGAFSIQEDNSIDYSLVITSLVHVILRPYCRTIQGFIELIEYEWIFSGHPFFDRNSRLFYIGNDAKSSPVFFLFLHCVYQIMHENFGAFEFKDTFLKFILEQSYSSKFVTFLYNSPKEIQQNNAFNEINSLKDFCLEPENYNQFLNPIYDSNIIINMRRLFCQNMILWEEIFYQSNYDTLNNHEERSWSALSKITKRR